MIRAKLKLVGGNATRREINLASLPLKIGRSSKADLPIAHAQISRDHCEIYELEGALVVRDNGSSNGTMINGEQVFEEILRPGDKLQVGPLTFEAVYEHDGQFPVLHEEDTYENLEVFDDGDDEEDVFFADDGDDDDDMDATVYNADILAAMDPSAAAKESGKSVVELSLDDLADDQSFVKKGYDEDYQEKDEFDNRGGEIGQDFGESSSLQAAEVEELLMPSFEEDTAEPKEQSALPEFDSMIEPIATARVESSEAECQYEQVEGFPIRLQLSDAGKIQVGTPVQVAGIEVGYVYNLTWAEAGGTLRAEALLIVQESLGGVLRVDAQIEVQDPHRDPVIVVLTPGSDTESLSPDQVVLPVDFKENGPTQKASSEVQSTPVTEIDDLFGDEVDADAIELFDPSDEEDTEPPPRNRPRPGRRR